MALAHAHTHSWQPRLYFPQLQLQLNQDLNFFSQEDISSKAKRGILPKHATNVMRSWLFQHIGVSFFCPSLFYCVSFIVFTERVVDHKQFFTIHSKSQSPLIRLTPALSSYIKKKRLQTAFHVHFSERYSAANISNVVDKLTITWIGVVKVMYNTNILW